MLFYLIVFFYLFSDKAPNWVIALAVALTAFDLWREYAPGTKR